MNKVPITQGKRGFSIPIATLAGALLILVMAALSMYSGQEMESVKTILKKKKTEYAAFSGLQWAYAKLFQGRWYQPDGNQFTNPGLKWKNSHKEEPASLSKEPQVKTVVYVDEVAADHFASPPPGKTGKVSLLDHINVLAYSSIGNESTLIYGKFIICPEPLLNSNSVNGYEQDTPLEADQGAIIESKVPAVLVNKGEEGLADMSKMILYEINRKPGDKVKKGDIIMVFGSICSDPGRTLATQRYYQKAAYDGVIESVKFTSSQIGGEVNIGDLAFTLKRDPGMRNSDVTLKKMVRITRIPLNVYGRLSLDAIGHRYEVYNYVADNTKDYVKNYTSSRDATPGIESAFVGVQEKMVLSEQEVIDKLSQGGTLSTEEYEVSGKMFMSDLLNSFSPPYNSVPKKVKDDFAKNSSFVLGVQPSEISSELKELLEILGPLHGKNYIEMMKTKPKENPELYKVKSTKSFMEVMDPKGSKTKVPGKQMDSVKYRDELSLLPDAAKGITVLLTEGTPWKPDYFEQLVSEGSVNREDYFFLPHKNGWYKTPPPDKVDFKSIPVHYWYENEDVKDPDTGNPFRLRMDYMMDFFRKHYHDGKPKAPADELRAEDEVRDEPQAPGPPDVTGAKYHGLSS